MSPLNRKYFNISPICSILNRWHWHHRRCIIIAHRLSGSQRIKQIVFFLKTEKEYKFNVNPSNKSSCKCCKLLNVFCNFLSTPSSQSFASTSHSHCNEICAIFTAKQFTMINIVHSSLNVWLWASHRIVEMVKRRFFLFSDYAA